MKVCFVNALFYPFRGGTENHMFELGEALVKQGIEVHVVTARLKGTKTEEKINCLKIHRVPAKIVKIPGLYPPPLVLCPNFLQYLQKIDERENFDLFHLHGRWFPDFTVVGKYCKKTNKPFVLTLHNARPIGISAAYTIFGSAYEMAIGKKVIKRADELIAVSKWTRDDVAKYDIPINKFTVIYNGINAREFSSKYNSKVKKQFQMENKDVLLVWVGRVIAQKGLKYLIKAMQLVLKENPTAKLLIIGTGTDLKKLKKLTSELGIGESIIFYGAENNRKKLNDLLRGCNAFVFPSIWEPFGIVAIEAMASGLPVIGVCTGGIPEIVENGKNGLLCPPKNVTELTNTINKFIKIKNKNKLKRNALKTARKKFNWEKIAKQTIKVYKKAS